MGAEAIFTGQQQPLDSKKKKKKKKEKYKIICGGYISKQQLYIG
jgi:hypothetical protein